MAAKSTTKRAGRDSDQFMVRLPDGMRKQLARAAERNGRSMNAEIVTALTMYFEHEDAASKRSELLGAETKKLAQTIEKIIRSANQQQTLELVKKIIQSPAESRSADDMVDMVDRLDRAIAPKK
jgi:plasmid stability protein